MLCIWFIQVVSFSTIGSLCLFEGKRSIFKSFGTWGLCLQEQVLTDETWSNPRYVPTHSAVNHYFCCMASQLMVCCVSSWGQTSPNHRWKLHSAVAVRAPGGLEPPYLFFLSSFFFLCHPRPPGRAGGSPLSWLNERCSASSGTPQSLLSLPIPVLDCPQAPRAISMEYPYKSLLKPRMNCHSHNL